MIFVMIYTVLFVLGLAFGSFINALVWRMHENATRQDEQKKFKMLSVWRGRSMCTHCKTTLGIKDLIPVFSWLRLRGKCRYCKKKIEDTPLAEVLLPALLISSYMVWPYGFDSAGLGMFAVWSLALAVMTALLVYDIRWMLLPNKIVYPFIGLAISVALVRVLDVGATVAFDALLGLASVGGVFYILHRVSGGAWIGGGDVKLGYGIGLLVGHPLLGFLTIFIASVFGSLVAIPQLARKKVTVMSRLPFGPFLILATVLVFLFADVITGWYADVFIYTL